VKFFNSSSQLFAGIALAILSTAVTSALLRTPQADSRNTPNISAVNTHIRFAREMLILSNAPSVNQINFVC
jgi:hypothetical protein